MKLSPVYVLLVILAGVIYGLSTAGEPLFEQYGFALLFIVLFAGVFTYVKYKQKRVIGKFEQGNLDEVLDRFDRAYRNAPTLQQQQQHLINKATILFLKGDWELSYQLLRSVDSDLLTPHFQVVYGTNRLVMTLLMEKYGEADPAYVALQDLLSHRNHDQALVRSAHHAIALYEQHLGDIEKSKVMFLDLVDKAESQLERALLYYHLGTIASQEGSRADAERYLKQASELGPMTFIPRKAQSLLEKAEAV